MKSKPCQVRTSFGFERFEPLISTQVLGAMIGTSPSAFATSEITGAAAPKAGATNIRKASAQASFGPRARAKKVTSSFILHNFSGTQGRSAKRDRKAG